MYSFFNYITEPFWKKQVLYEGGKIAIARKQELQLEVYVMLKTVMDRGVQLYLEGEITSPEVISREYCLNEECIYMPDYVINDAGELVELRYDRIRDT